jgi:hypothetical protein
MNIDAAEDMMKKVSSLVVFYVYYMHACVYCLVHITYLVDIKPHFQPTLIELNL